MDVKVQMNLEIEDDFLDEIKKIEHHAEYLLDLESYPEILTVYGVKVEVINTVS